jgi:hypothetical protein
MSEKIISLKWYSAEEIKNIDKKYSERIVSNIKIEVDKLITSSEIDDFLSLLNIRSKKYWSIELVAMTESIKGSIFLLLSGISREEYNKVMQEYIYLWNIRIVK